MLDIIDLFFHNDKLIADWLFIGCVLIAVSTVLQLISKYRKYSINSLNLNIYNLDLDRLWFRLKKFIVTSITYLIMKW